MRQSYFRHIFLSGPNNILGYTNPRHGGDNPRNPPRDRAAHSAYLQQRLAEAWAASDNAQAVIVADRQGDYVEFSSAPGFDLVIKSLENIKSGIRLLNAKRQIEAAQEKTYATVYIPKNKRQLFLNKLQKYSEENVQNTGKPKNANLVESISDIRSAILRSFWQDDLALLPNDDRIPIEVWLSSDNDKTRQRFNQLLSQLEIPINEGYLNFPERVVEVIHANLNDLNKLILMSDDVAEFRSVNSTASYLIELSNIEQIEYIRNLLKRITFVPNSDIVICLLDTGVNNGHLLLQPVLNNNDLLSVRTAWGINDHDGHGTLMAGTAVYGDLLPILNNQAQIKISHRLESVKILPPNAQNPKELWGYITSQGISRAEIQAPQRKRVICMAVTSPEDRDRGRPSSWSAMIDSLTSGYQDDKKRLIIISAGNVEESHNWLLYPQSNITDEVHNPGQSWNALTIGSFTDKVHLHDPTLAGYTPIALAGGLSPFSTTSSIWEGRKWPIKPEVVFEGGNAARGPNDSIIDPEDLSLLSTYHDPQIAQLGQFNMTSASAAQASCLAAQILTQYPDIWPETVRALIVHSAQWTGTMRSQFLPATPTKPDYAKLLRICGYGTPNLIDALYCASNSLTLVSQAELQPFDRGKDGYITKDMHLYSLPWPSAILSGLGETQVTMRITLSYFIEPGPGEIGWENRYRYSSFGIRFDVNGPTESQDNFIRRINMKARDDGEHPGTQGPSDKWIIGEARNVGSIHSDIWKGRAVDLASSNKIAIYPTVGWWRERSNLNRWDRKCRYSLVVSIHTPSTEIDIYTPVAIQVGLVVPINIPINT
jgi:hypothetical protein